MSGIQCSVALRNTKVDPNTGEVYLDKNDPLEMILSLSGITAPYKVGLDWGDGEKVLRDKEKEIFWFE